MPDTSSLIQRWLDGDEWAAEALYNEHRESIFRLAYGLLGQPNDAEEVAQDSLTYALSRINQYDPEKASFDTWLHTITLSRCRDRKRRKRWPTLSLSGWLERGSDPPDATPTPEHHTEQKETRSEVLTAVQSLKPKLREAILLRYWAGHTYQEMADILDCPLRTAQSRVRLAYKQLRVSLAPTNETYSFEEKRVQ